MATSDPPQPEFDVFWVRAGVVGFWVIAPIDQLDPLSVITRLFPDEFRPPSPMASVETGVEMLLFKLGSSFPIKSRGIHRVLCQNQTFSDPSSSQRLPFAFPVSHADVRSAPIGPKSVLENLYFHDR